MIKKSFIVGKGSTGLVFRRGNLVYKNACSTEADIYQLLKGKPGIAPGYQADDKIVTPYYPLIISIDAVPPQHRLSFAPIVQSNIDRINKAISYLSSVGYEYSDPLQFGYRNGQMFLLDFSNGNKNFPDDVVKNNLFELSRFYKTFGLDQVAHCVSSVSEVLCNQITRAKNNFLFDFFGDCFDGINYRLIHCALRGQPAGYAYYGRYIEEVRISQTQIRGVNVVLSTTALPASIIKRYQLVNVFAS